MILLLLLLGESSVPLEPPVTVDVIEFNQVRPGTNHQNLDQFIFWRWSEYRDRHGLKYGRFDVVAWRMADDHRPEYCHKRRKWCLRWMEHGRIITVWATSYRQTKTRFDVEVDQRGVLACDKRQGFTP